VRLDTIGDLVLMSPFLRELRLSNPNAWITLVVDPRFVNLVELCPHVNEVLTFDPRFMGRLGRLQTHFRALHFARSYLWRRKFDLALLPRWGIDLCHAAFVAYFSRAKCRVGYSENVSSLKQHLNRNFDAFFTRTLDDRKPKHEVERNLDFLRAVGGTAHDDPLELWLSEEDREQARKLLVSRGVRHADLVLGLAPGAGHPKRRWPIDRFIELGRFLEKEFGARLLVVGGPDDADGASRLTEELGSTAVNVSGGMTLRQTAALLTQTRLMVSNDCGPMHLAAAVGTPTVAIWGSSDSRRWRPWRVEHRLIQNPFECNPCPGYRCLVADSPLCIESVTVAQVNAAVEEMLAGAEKGEVL